MVRDSERVFSRQRVKASMVDGAWQSSETARRARKRVAFAAARACPIRRGCSGVFRFGQVSTRRENQYQEGRQYIPSVRTNCGRRPLSVVAEVRRPPPPYKRAGGKP
eukprot:2496839-Pyramimonas_sp.AAC.1